MRVLDKPLRNKLESAVKSARDIAEAGSRIALQALAVDAAEPFSHQTPDDRDLRNRLRARARQIGDQKVAGNGKHGIIHLVQECAYEHWHRMLFARFLAENGLLMHPEGVAVTLKECEELAPEEGAENGWELAARYASKMLPQIFRPDAPVLQIKLPPEHQHKLEKLLDDLAVDTFKARDSLGWVYQFWQAKKKDEINASEVKIGADELPAVTQLFTEPYMVDFLLQNTLGAWWVGRHGRETLPVEMPYLRFLDDGIPAAGTFDGWPDRAAEITVLDPCCGSGHFLVAAFDILVRFRMVEEGLSADEAGDAVLRNNIHGLEIDERCTQIAAFALAFAAWTFPGSAGYRPLPSMKIACSGLSLSVERSEWVQLIGDDSWLQSGMGLLYDLFEKAPILGSLIDTATVGLDQHKQGTLETANIVSLLPKLKAALSGLKSSQDYQQRELGITAKGAVDALDMILKQYTLVATNVPYLAKGKQHSFLVDFCLQLYSDAKNDLATVFLDRLLRLLDKNGTVSIVLPQTWLFLTGFKKFRVRMLKDYMWNFLVRLGPGSFETISGEIVNVCLLIVSSSFLKVTHDVAGIEAATHHTIYEKMHFLREGKISKFDQLCQLTNPNSVIRLDEVTKGDLLERYGTPRTGLQTGDNDRFSYLFWEIPVLLNPWIFFQRTADKTTHYSGAKQILRWHPNGKELKENPGSAIRGVDLVGGRGIFIHRMSSLPVTLFLKEMFDQNGATFILYDNNNIPAIWCYLSSQNYNVEVRKIDTKIGVTPATLGRVPIDLDYWRMIADEKYPNGLPKPYSDDPTQWIFHGHPCGSVIWDAEKKWTHIAPLRTDEIVLQVAVARLLGYCWPAESDSAMELSDESRHWVKKSEELLPFADKDGIACIPPVRGEEPAHVRLLNLLTAAYGDQWSSSIREALLKDVGCEGKDLDFWLRNKFFEQHHKLYHHRPFIWHIWDGLKDGFGVLVNYHKLDKKLLEALTYNYLGDWIKRQEDDLNRKVDGAAERLSAARVLKEKLELILHGEQPYDIFVRWKPLHEQPVGWIPDLNDGVRLNIRPFMTTGILRKNPNINWGKDRGKDTQDSPWFHLFNGDRINDHHLSLTEKINARFQIGND